MHTCGKDTDVSAPCSLRNPVVPEKDHVMRLAVYNVENLFDRPKVMNLGTWM